MEYYKQIISENPELIQSLSAFEEHIAQTPLSDRFYEIQTLNERTDEEGIAKWFLMYLDGEQEVQREIKRILGFHDKIAKVNFLIKQLESSNTEIVYKAIELMGIAKEQLAIPYLNAVLKPENIELTERVIIALGEINGYLGAQIVKRNLKITTNRNLLLLCLKILSRWIELVSWKIFVPFLMQDDKEIKLEAAFAIALRKAPQSAKYVQMAINQEVNPNTKLTLTEYLGRIPSKQNLMPLINMCTHDPSQRVRLIASRTLDRLQGILSAQNLYELRNLKDIRMRAEVLFRLGKFGSENENHKRYLKKVLEESNDPHIIQAILSALGLI
ncbi:HEAT repeat domain-containing protein [bacterium]|nr:HEAT repeat domain-containing protein [bacterium]